MTNAEIRSTITCMSLTPDNLVKARDISFCALHPDPNQAGSAAAVLMKTEGIARVEVIAPCHLKLSYYLTSILMGDIEALLAEQGFHLDNRLTCKIKRALYRYSDETQYVNMGCAKGESNCTRKVFINRYQHLNHGCQDKRPDHWRRYL